MDLLRPLLRVGPAFGGIALVWWRMRETRVPVTARSILIPPLGMSTGLFMFISRSRGFHGHGRLIALATGALVFSWPVVRSSRLEARDGHIYLQRSPGFS
jgi:membrane protein CcdC involved in cytochrome C biogenesis